MNIRALIFNEEKIVDNVIFELREENAALHRMIAKHYCTEHDKWFEKAQSLSLHLRWHNGNNPFKK